MCHIGNRRWPGRSSMCRIPTINNDSDNKGMIKYCNVFVVNLTWPGISLSLVNIHIADPSLVSLFVQDSLELDHLTFHILEHVGFFFFGLRIMSYPFAAHLVEAVSNKLDMFSSYQSI